MNVDKGRMSAHVRDENEGALRYRPRAIRGLNVADGGEASARSGAANAQVSEDRADIEAVVRSQDDVDVVRYSGVGNVARDAPIGDCGIQPVGRRQSLV